MIEDDEFRMSSESRRHLARNYTLFAVMGAGANWLLPTILFQQIPWLEERVPEGLCIATYLNTVNSFALIGTLAYCYINKYHYPIPNEITMPFILSLSAIGTFFAAFTYNLTLFGHSVYLFIATFIGATVGSLSAVIMNPFMTQFENIYITAARSGGSGGFLLCALLGIIQSPGSNTRFSPMVFLLIFSALLVLPLLAYRTIVHENIGLRVPPSVVISKEVELHESEKRSGPVDSDTQNSKGSANPLHTSSTTVASKDVALQYTSGKGDEEEASDRYHESDAFLCVNTKAVPWFNFTLPYALSIGFVNFNTWGMLSAVTPFAMHHAARGVSGSFLLALCYEIGCFTLVAGDISTAFVKFPFKICLPVFGALSLAIYLAALNMDGFHTIYSGPFLVVAFCVGRFIEAHILTESFRIIATHVPRIHREDASRMLGIADQISTVLGVVTSTVLVSQLARC